MIEETVLNDSIINKLLKEKYGIDVKDIKKIDRGTANLYSLNDESYVLKEFQSKYSKVEIDKEIRIINHLKNDDLMVPEYIITKDDEFSFIYEGKVITLQKFIEGYTMDSNTGNYEQMIESGRELGKMVKSLESIDFELPNNSDSFSYDSEFINKSITKHKKLLEKLDVEKEKVIAKNINEKIFMLEYLKNTVDFEELKKLTLANTHGDYSVLQFIYKDDKINAIVDFVSACKMPIVWEVIRSYSYIDKEAKNGRINVDHLTDYVKEFNKYVKMTEFDLKNMSYLYLIQLLSSTFGYKQYILDNSKKELLEFAFFRTNLCRDLFENAELISERLKKVIIESE